MIFGESRFNIVYGSTSYTPAGWCSLVPDIQDLNLQRRSKITSQENVRDLWTYYNANAKVKNLTVSEIAFFRTISGKEVTLTPCIDKPLISYAVSVTRAEIKYEDGKPWKPYIDLRFDGVYDVEILCIADLFITITSPTTATYLNGNNMNITWTSSNIPATEPVKIELYKAGVYVSTMTNYTLNTGSYTWKIAAVLIGSDYQVKITVLRDTDIYVLSSALSITYDGWVRPDGSNDYALTKCIPTASMTRTFAWFYRSSSFANGIVFANWTDASNYEFVSHYNNSIRYMKYIGAMQSVLSATTPVTGGAWHSIVVVIDLSQAVSASRCRMWFDAVEKSMAVSASPLDQTPFSSVSGYSLFAINSVIGYTGFLPAQDIKHMIYSETVWDQDKITAYHALNIDAANTAMWLRCNDADAGTPWTDNMLDSSGNAKHATPVSINGATFFNQTPQWRTDEDGEIIPDENNEPITIL